MADTEAPPAAATAAVPAAAETPEAETPEAEPVAAEPKAEETTAPEPTALEATAPEPTASESTAPEPAAPESTAPEPAAPESTAPAPAAPEPTALEPAAPEPTAPEPAAAEPAAAEPAAAASTPVDLAGRWQLVRNENFNEYLKAAGVGFVTRKLICSLSPVVEIQQEGDDFKTAAKTPMGLRLNTFKVGVEYPESSPMWGDKKEHRVLPEWQGAKLVQREVHAPDGDTPKSFEREIVNGELVMTMRRGEMAAKRYFKKL